MLSFINWNFIRLWKENVWKERQSSTNWSLRYFYYYIVRLGKIYTVENFWTIFKELVKNFLTNLRMSKAMGLNFFIGKLTKRAFMFCKILRRLLRGFLQFLSVGKLLKIRKKIFVKIFWRLQILLKYFFFVKLKFYFWYIIFFNNI